MLHKLVGGPQKNQSFPESLKFLSSFGAFSGTSLKFPESPLNKAETARPVSLAPDALHLLDLGLALDKALHRVLHHLHVLGLVESCVQDGLLQPADGGHLVVG